MDPAKLREAAIAWGEQAARRLMAEGKSHAGPVTRRVFREPELIALLAVAFEAGAVTADAAHKARKRKR